MLHSINLLISAPPRPNPSFFVDPGAGVGFGVGSGGLGKPRERGGGRGRAGLGGSAVGMRRGRRPRAGPLPLATLQSGQGCATDRKQEARN